MARDISNMDDIIDSRDVIARIEELREEIESEEISEDNGADVQTDDDGKTIVRTATCGECGKSWNDALITGRTPAPSARCPYEHMHDEIAELKALEALAEEGEACGDWEHGEALVRDSHFEDYAQELAEDCGMLENATGWPCSYIDWERAARDLKMDYTALDFDGVTYYARS